MSRWRVATFNIHHGAPARGPTDLSALAAAIAGLDVDVIGLQEVDQAFGERSGHQDQAARLGEMLGMEQVFAPALTLPGAAGGPPRRYGLALLTRHRVLAHTHHCLPAAGDGPAAEPRALLHARLSTDVVPSVDVLVTHLDHRHRPHRERQVQELIARSGTGQGPAVLLGDMNTDPVAPELAALAAAGWREVAQDLPGREHRDRLRALGRGPGRARPTFPARLPLRRIDAIWIRGDLRALDLEVVATRVSDHRPVVATLGHPGAGSTVTA